MREIRTYQCLTDASLNCAVPEWCRDILLPPELKEPKLRVWYVVPKSQNTRQVFGLMNQSTHVLVGTIRGWEMSYNTPVRPFFERLKQIYTALQHEIWSPFGEAEEMLRCIGLNRQSMEVYDVIEYNATDICRLFQLVDSKGTFMLI